MVLLMMTPLSMLKGSVGKPLRVQSLMVRGSPQNRRKVEGWGAGHTPFSALVHPVLGLVATVLWGEGAEVGYAARGQKHIPSEVYVHFREVLGILSPATLLTTES